MLGNQGRTRLGKFVSLPAMNALRALRHPLVSGNLAPDSSAYSTPTTVTRSGELAPFLKQLCKDFHSFSNLSALLLGKPLKIARQVFDSSLLTFLQ